MMRILPEDADEAMGALCCMGEGDLRRMSLLLEAVSRDEGAAMVMAEETCPDVPLADLMLEARRCHLLIEFYVGALLTPA